VSVSATIEVPGFEHLPGNHCGSTALRNLLHHHGLSISEELAFGLGAGPCFYFVVVEEGSPSRFINGRTSRLEEEFLRLTSVPLRLRTTTDPEQSWRLAAEVVRDGRPTILLTDIYYLDHYGSSAHFPGHAVVLAGFDQDSAYVADTAFPELQRTSLAGLAKARHAAQPIYPLAGQMVDLPPGASLSEKQLRAAVPGAIEAAARRMLEPELAPYEGLPALQRFAAEVGSWPEVAPDWQWCARFSYQVIERRGTGGGNFRAMYSQFLSEVGRPEAALARRAAAAWSALAEALFEASEQEQPSAPTWRAIAGRGDEVLAAERRLWEALA
jgi:hypothetical protein